MFPLQQLLSHNPVNVAYPPPQLSTVPVSNHSGGVPLMNSQAVSYYIVIVKQCKFLCLLSAPN